MEYEILRPPLPFCKSTWSQLGKVGVLASLGYPGGPRGTREGWRPLPWQGSLAGPLALACALTASY